MEAPFDLLYDDERKEALDLVRSGQLYLAGHTRNLQFATHLHAEYFTYMHYRQKVPTSGFVVSLHDASLLYPFSDKAF